MTRGVAVAVAGPEHPAPPPRRRARWWAVAAAMTAAVAASLGLWLLAASQSDPAPTFEVWDAEAERAVYTRPVAVGETFRVEHTHSVTRSLVIETFSVHDEHTIAVEELWFDEFGPNLPAGAERIGERTTTFLSEEGGYRVLHHGQPIGTVPLLVGSPEVDHVVTFEDGKRLRLLDVARAGGRVELAVGGR